MVLLFSVDQPPSLPLFICSEWNKLFVDLLRDRRFHAEYLSDIPKSYIRVCPIKYVSRIKIPMLSFPSPTVTTGRTRSQPGTVSYVFDKTNATSELLSVRSNNNPYHAPSNRSTSLVVSSSNAPRTIKELRTNIIFKYCLILQLFSIAPVSSISLNLSFQF